MSQEDTSTLSASQWNSEWKRAQSARRPPDDPSYWDKRAPSFEKTAGTTPYAATFLEYAELRPEDTVFDMGCGSGTLALPLVRNGHQVWGGDFSQVMLDLMMKRAEEEQLTDRLHPSLLSWHQDWTDADIPVCDVAFASRSIATDDLQEALTKLMSKARRRVCLTVSDGLSPRHDAVLMKVMGRERNYDPDYIYCMNILWGMGIRPELRFIESVRSSRFSSFEHAIEKTCELADATSAERDRLITYTKEHLHPTTPNEEGSWEYDHVRTVSWAFISWNKA